jgi:hypothetical protein
MLISQGHVVRLGRVSLSRTLAVVDGHDDRSRLCESLGHVDIHAKLGRAGIETVNLGDRLGTTRRSEGHERGKAEDLHGYDIRIDKAVLSLRVERQTLTSTLDRLLPTTYIYSCMPIFVCQP